MSTACSRGMRWTNTDKLSRQRVSWRRGAVEMCDSTCGGFKSAVSRQVEFDRGSIYAIDEYPVWNIFPDDEALKTDCRLGLLLRRKSVSQVVR